MSDRITNIDLTKGLIRRYFAKKDKESLKHGPSLLIDFENSLKRSKLETARYEFKQGLFDLDENKKFNEKLVTKILKTATAIANTAQGEDGFIYIGIADNLKDATKSKKVYGEEYIEYFGKYILGIDRELKKAEIESDQYLKILMDRIRKSPMDADLKTQILTQIDVVVYRNLSVIRIRIPKQNQLTFWDEEVYVRNNSDTKQVTNPKEILALSINFKQSYREN